VLEGDAHSDHGRAEKRLEYLAEADLDVAVFQPLPLHTPGAGCAPRESDLALQAEEDDLVERLPRR